MEGPGSGMPQQRVGRRRSTTPHHITDVAIDLFTARGFAEVSVDDVAAAAGISRRTLFRYYASKNAIPWGDFDTHLARLRELLDNVESRYRWAMRCAPRCWPSTPLTNPRPRGTDSACASSCKPLSCKRIR